MTWDFAKKNGKGGQLTLDIILEYYNSHKTED